MSSEGDAGGPRIPRFTPRQRQLTVATVLCYLVGYPLALTVAPAVGWSLVMIGGLFLLGLGAVTINRVHREADEASARTLR